MPDVHVLDTHNQLMNESMNESINRVYLERLIHHCVLKPPFWGHKIFFVIFDHFFGLNLYGTPVGPGGYS